MRISVNASSFHAFTQAADVKVSLCSAGPTAAASSGHTALLAGLCVVSVFLFAALMVIFKQNLGPVTKLLAQVNGLFDRIRVCLPGAGSAPEGRRKWIRFPPAMRCPLMQGGIWVIQTALLVSVVLLNAFKGRFFFLVFIILLSLGPSIDFYLKVKIL